MASWPEIKEHIAASYDVIRDDGASLMMEIELLPMRVQRVVLTQQTLLGGSEEWVVIESPFAVLGEVDLMHAATSLGEMVCGGIGTLDRTYATVRHAVPLAKIDVDDFEDRCTS